MKRLIVYILLALALSFVVSSCRSYRPPCPAYKG